MSITVSDELRQARSALEQARELLLAPSPTHVERCAAHLESAVRRMVTVEERVRLEGAGGTERVVPGLRMELEFVRQELRRVSALLEHAAAFHMSWAGMLSLIGSGYTSSGQPTAVSGSGRIAVRG